MGVIDELVLRITADPSGLVAGLGTAQAEVAGFGAEADAAGDSAAGLGAGLEGAGAGAGEFSSELGAAGASTVALDASMSETAGSATALEGGLAGAGAGASGLEEGMGGAAAASGAAAGGIGDAGAAASEAGVGLAGAGEEAGGFGTSLASAGAVGAAGIGIAGAAIGAFSMKAASDVGGAYKSIIKDTGATGTQLDMLKASFRDIASSVPNSMQDVAAAESDVYDKSKELTNGIQLTGPALDDMTTKFLNWSRISGASVTSLVDETSAWSGAWKMNASQVSASMDTVNTASQRTGESVSTIAMDLQRVAPAAIQLGLSFNQTTAAVTGFEEAGLKAQTLTTAMSKVFQDAQKDHQNATQRWNEDTQAIQDYVKKGASAVQGTTEWDQVTKDFSGKTLTSMITAVKEGKLSIADLNAMLENSKGSIDDTADSTKTFGQNLDEFKNKLEVAFAPLGTSIINALEGLLNAMTPIIPVITAFVNAFTNLPMPIQEGAMALVAIVGGAAVADIAFKKFGGSITDVIGDFNKLKSAGSGLFGGATKSAESGVAADAEGVAAKGGAGGTCLGMDPSCVDRMRNSTQGLKGDLGEVTGEGEQLTEGLAGSGEEMTGVGEAAAVTAGESGGILSSITGVLGGLPLIGGLFGGAADAAGGAAVATAGIGEAAAGGTAALGSGGMLGGITAILGAIPGIGWAILAVVGVFAVLTATSATFRSMLGGVVTTIQQIFGWVMQLVGALGSGNFSKAGDLLKSGFQGAIDAITHFDYGQWGAKMIQAFQESFATIASIAGPALASIGNVFSGIFNTLSTFDWGGAFAGLLDQADNILTGIMNYLEGADWSGIFTQIINMIGGVFDSLFGGSSGGGGSAGSKVTDGMSGSLSKGVQKAGPDIIGKLGDVLKKLLEIAPEIFYKIGTALIEALEKVDWGAVFDKMISGPFMSAMAHAIGGIGGMLAGALGGLGGMISSALSGAGGFITGMIGQIPGFVTQLATQLMNGIKTFSGGLGKWFYDALISVYQFDQKLWNQLLNTVKTYMGGFGKWLYDAAITVYALDTKLADAIKNAVVGFGTWLWDGVADLGTKLWSAITGAIGSFGSWLWGLISGTGTQLWGAITGALGTFGTWLWGLISGTGTQLWGAITGALGTFGTWLWGLISDTGTKLWTAISTALATFGTWLWGLISDIGTKMWGAIQSAVGQFGSWLNGLVTVGADMWSKITSAVGQFGSWLGGLVSGIGSTIWGLISGAVGQFGSWLGGLVSGIGSTIWGDITGALGGFGSWLGSQVSGIGTTMYNDITGAFGSFASWIAGLFTQAQVSFTIPILNKTVTFNLEEGAYVSKRPGGILARIGEGAEDEIVAPVSKLENLSSLSNIKHLAGGGIVSKSGNVSALPGASAASKGGNTYQITINVNGQAGQINENKLVQLLLDAEIAQGLPY